MSESVQASALSCFVVAVRQRLGENTPKILRVPIEKQKFGDCGFLFSSMERKMCTAYSNFLDDPHGINPSHTRVPSGICLQKSDLTYS